MRKIYVLVPLLALFLIAGCGGEATNNETSETAAAETPANQPMTYEQLVAKHGEEKIKEIYVDVTAHAQASFLSGDLLGISTKELMEMSAEERQEYAVEQGKKKGQEVARRMGEAVESYGLNMSHWRVISEYANNNDWSQALSDRVEARKEELKAEYEAQQGEAEASEEGGY